MEAHQMIKSTQNWIRIGSKSWEDDCLFDVPSFDAKLCKESLILQAQQIIKTTQNWIRNWTKPCEDDYFFDVPMWMPNCAKILGYNVFCCLQSLCAGGYLSDMWSQWQRVSSVSAAFSSFIFLHLCVRLACLSACPPVCLLVIPVPELFPNKDSCGSTELLFAILSK